jgi:hypothetical protein
MSKNLNFVALVLFLIILLIIVKKPDSAVDQEEIPEETVIKEEEEVKKPEVKIEPEWVVWNRVKEFHHPRFGKVLNDIESHIEDGHSYRDNRLMTWAHETTHGINNNIRNDHDGFNGFYVLNDRAILIQEPKVLLSQVASKIPEDLRGPSYNLYLVQQRWDWNERPLYLFDEWTAYTNGSACGIELNLAGWEFELMQAHNFNIYCLYLMKEVKSLCPEYDDRQMKAYLQWNIERTFDLLNSHPRGASVVYIVSGLGHREEVHADSSVNFFDVAGYIDLFRVSASAEDLREFMRGYFGAEWCQRIYRI